MKCDILIAGGGTGGCAAAMAACDMGASVVLVEPTDWIGGQLTAQAVPPDEHPWIESFGCTARYRRFRNDVRAWYRENTRLSQPALADPELNPGQGWVSRLCFDPRVGVAVLEGTLQPHVASGRLTILRRSRVETIATTAPNSSEATVLSEESGSETVVESTFVLDATEEGDLLPKLGVPYKLGAESRDETNEPSALQGPAEIENVQSFTWVAAIQFDPNGSPEMEKPKEYDKWKAHAPGWWGGPLFTWDGYGADPNKPMRFGLYDECPLFTYRRIIASESFEEPVVEVSLLNWPHNDYTGGTILDVSRETRARHLDSARQQTLSVVYWLRTEAPRPDGGQGFPEIGLCSNVVGTPDGLAKYPYIREARRLVASRMLTELDVAAACNEGRDRMKPITDSVGIGAYRIDLHPSANGRKSVDVPSLPFQVPLGCLIPQGGGRLLAAGKCLGATHIANGCTRLHPTEWNVGESAGALAAFCIAKSCEPLTVLDDAGLLADYQSQLANQGVELAWPESVELSTL